MLGRRTLATVTAAAVGALAWIGVAAPPATGADFTTAMCQTAPEGADTTGTLYLLLPGDVLTLTLPAECEFESGGTIEVEGLETTDSEYARLRFLGPESIVFVVSVSNATGTTTLVLGLGCGNPEIDGIIAETAGLNITVIDACNPATGNGPPPVLQQTSPLSDGTCAITDPAYDWAGVASGGWSRSWAQWANGGAGGAVCTRTLEYSGSTGRWVVAG